MLRGIKVLLGVIFTLCGFLSGQSWISLTPQSRSAASLVYDPIASRLILFGGRGYEGNLNDLYSFEPDIGWQPLNASGTVPSQRYQHAAIYRSVSNEMVIFGGYNDGALFNDLYSLSLSEGSEVWEQITPSGSSPEPRRLVAACYDPINDRLIIFGGATSGGKYTDELWGFDFQSGNWSQITWSGNGPEARVGARAIYDPETQRMIIFGGVDNYSDFLNDVWALDLTLGNEHWVELSPSGTPPEGRVGFVMAFDPSSHIIYIHAGYSYYNGYFQYYNDLWTLSLNTLTWQNLSPSGALPTPRRHPSGEFLPGMGGFLVFGGELYPILLMGDTYLFQPAPVGSKERISKKIGGKGASLSVYPNPTTGPLHIKLEIPQTSEISLSALNEAGRSVQAVLEKRLSSGEHILQWNFPKDLPHGIYHFLLKTPQESKTVKVSYSPIP